MLKTYKGHLTLLTNPVNIVWDNPPPPILIKIFDTEFDFKRPEMESVRQGAEDV